MSNYGQLPRDLGVHQLTLTEHMSYLYLPVRMANEIDGRIPENLRPIQKVLNAITTLYAEKDDYVYVTAKRGYGVQSRPGWHSDGFGTKDTNVIWSRGLPTVFSNVDFPRVPEGHAEAMAYFTKHAEQNIVTHADMSVLVMDETVVHRAPVEIGDPQPRQFVKISISKQRYNLEGNSHNYLFDYKWKMYDRKAARNMEHYEERDYVDPRW